jgi:transcriptional regulator with XRE-family HTH domain
MARYAKQINMLRERSGRTMEEMASLLGMSYMEYFDLELHDDELYTVPSLRQVGLMCKAFGISPVELVAFERKPETLPQHISFSNLMIKIKGHIALHSLTLEEFENEVGWNLVVHVQDPENIWDEPIEFLQDVCAPMGIDWIAVIPR